MLVVNTSATLPGQLDGVRAGRPVVVHVANRLADGTRVVELRTAAGRRRPVLDGRAGEQIELPGGGRGRPARAVPGAGLVARPATGNRLWRGAVRVPATAAADYLAAHARPISYGYLRGRSRSRRTRRSSPLHPGSAEMPSAARPFSAELVARLVAAGVVFAPITLHTGVSSQEAQRGAAGRVVRGRRDDRRPGQRRPRPRRPGDRGRHHGDPGHRVGHRTGRHVVAARSGWTELVISPDRPVRVVDGLITGWHNPDASHLLLVESVAGPELTQRAYDAAVAERYLWHEFGDSGLLLP